MKMTEIDCASLEARVLAWTEKQARYEYAGFIYLVGDNHEMMPLPGQHPAAGKEKHRRAAREAYLKETRHD